MDVPSPAEGVVKSMTVQVGDKVSQGHALSDARKRCAGASRGRVDRSRRHRRHRSRPRRRRHLQPRSPPHDLRRGEQGACARDPRRRVVHRARRHRMRDARARRGSRRLFRRVSCRRSRHEDGARRALRDARRRVPQRRLHSIEGAAAHGGGDGRSEDDGRARHHVTPRRRSISTSCAASRTASCKQLTGGLAGMAKARKVDVVRGIGRFLDPHHLEVQRYERQRPRSDGREEDRSSFAEGDHRRRQRSGEAAVHAGRSARRRFDRRARAAVDPEADARRRRRHHRARDGERLLDARQRASTSSKCWTA